MKPPIARSSRRRFGLLAATMLLGLSACATPFKADVKRFTMQLPPSGTTFAVVADDPRDAGGLEFGQYADLVAAEMARHGYVRTAPEHAAMLVRFDFGVDQGRDRIRSRPGIRDPYWGPWYGPGFYGRPFRRYGAWGYGWHDPFFFDSGYDVDVVTVYTSEAVVKIDRRVDGQRLFEGKAQAASRSNRLNYLVPNLVQAIFTDFPGHSGETLRISIAPDDGTTSVKRID